MELVSLLNQKIQNGIRGAIHFFLAPCRMKNIYNAVSDCLEDLELEGHCDASIQEISTEKYRVTFQERRNGNNKVVIEVEYCRGLNLASSRFVTLDDDAWHEWIEIDIVERVGISEITANILYEELAFQIDETHFDSESEDDDETLSIASQPLTPPPSRAQ